MTGIIYDLPEPPAGREWCTGCVLLLRGKCDQEYGSMAAELGKDGKPGWKVVKPDLLAVKHLRTAVVSAPFALAPELGILRVCWTCVAGMAPVRRSPIAVPDGLLPGRGRG